jgi:L-asparaginase
VDGIVVTAGTNPLDELAYFLHLAAKTTQTIVVTGAMRPSSGLGADGPLNLVNAVRVAVSPEAVGLGVLVVMNETIYSARDVTKNSTHRVQAFVARDTGPIGYADADRIAMLHRPIRRHTLETEFSVAGRKDLPRVDVVLSYVGADEALIDAAVAVGARGLVSAGSGAGRPGARENAAFDRAVASGVTVCQASRVGSGRVTLSPWLLRRGLIAAGDLQPWKARVLLMLALTVTTDRAAIQQMFDTY